MAFNFKTRSMFLTLDTIGFHIGTRKWELSWTKGDGWCWGRTPSNGGR